MPLILTEKNFQLEVLESPVPVLVDFWAPWCGPCSLMLPILEELAKEVKGRFKVGKINVDENPDLAQKYEITSVPGFKIFKAGKLVKSFHGVQSQETLKKELESA